MKITKQQHQEWLSHPVTEKFFNGIAADYEEAVLRWVLNTFGSDKEAIEAQASARIAFDLLNHEYVEFVEVDDAS